MSGTITVRKIEEISNGLKQFIKLPYKIYANSPYWVPQPNFAIKTLLDKKKNPFFEHASMQLFLAERNNTIVGRIAAIKNDAHNKYHNDNVGFWGFFESINDQEVADNLFEAVKKWLKESGCDVMRGPANPSSNDEYGLLINGFDDTPRLMMTYNHPYYAKLSENYGLKKIKDLFAYELFNEDTLKSDKLIRGNEIIRKRYNITIRSLDLNNFARDLQLFKEVYNNAWSLNWGFVPLTDKEIDNMAKELKLLIEPDLAIFAEINGKVVGATLCIPDFNVIFKRMNGSLLSLSTLKLFFKKLAYKEIKHIRIVTLGITHEHQKKGLDTVLYYEILQRAKEIGLNYGEASWILEDNAMMNRGLEMLNAKIYKQYRIYEMPI